MKQYDRVKVVNKRGEIIKRGVISGLTTKGALIFDDKTRHPYTDSWEFTEWFPFSSKEIRIIEEPQRLKTKASVS